MYLVVGCGLSGAVVAERIATVLKESVLIIEKTHHIGGNCYDYIDEETGILCSKYGPHFFHTNNERVWEYINLFAIDWQRWDHKVLSFVDDKFVTMPINITTVNLCNTHIRNTDEMNEWLNSN